MKTKTLAKKYLARSLDERYPEIRKWGNELGSFNYYIENQQLQAEADGAPSDAVYRRDNGTWATRSEIEKSREETQRQNEARERLNSAAPALLKACKALLTMSGGPEGLDMGGPIDPREVRQMAIKAIADAEIQNEKEAV